LKTTSNPINRNLKLLITNKANDKLRAYVDHIDTEISGMAKSKITADKNALITDFIIFEQSVNGSATKIDDASQAKFLFDLMKNGGNPEEWNVWWHSHCDMGVCWSTTDDDTIQHHTNQSYLISLVTNKAGLMKARLDVFPKDTSPFNKKTFCKFDINDIEIIKTKKEINEEARYEKELIKIEKEFDEKIKVIDNKYNIKKDKEKIIKQCQTEIKEKVRKIEPLQTKTDLSWPSDNKKFQKTSNKKWDWFDNNNKYNKSNFDKNYYGNLSRYNNLRLS
jgi:hypothetical protein